ncbi:MAG: glycoside hydrolase family 2 protein [Bacillota bacterium]
MISQKEKIQSLNGQWLFIKDANEQYTYSEVEKEYNFTEDIAEMKIPQNWQLAGLDNYNGAVWFIRQFDLISDADETKFLVFSGVDYFTDIWINGRFLGHHEGYFQKFSFNITSEVKEKSNLLIVKVTSPREEPGTVWPLKKRLIKGIFNHHDCRPGGWSYECGQDKNTGGIWNDVYIEYDGKVHVEAVKIISKLNAEKTKALLLLEISYESSLNFPLEDQIEIGLFSPGGKNISKTCAVTFYPHKDKTVISISVDNPELWWSWDLGAQNLYTLKLTSKIFNEKQTSFGIREVSLNKSGEFFINGKRLFLRGTNIIPTQWLSELDKEKINQQIRLIKQANINAVRVHAHVNREEFYDECDRQGIILWQDFPLQWTYEASEEFILNGVRQIKEMVLQLYNHASIAFWCCHNEPGDQIKTLDPALYDSVISEDNTRIVRLASNYEEHAYEGWYWGKMEHYEAAPMGPLVTEFGAQALPGRTTLEKFIEKEKLYPPDWEVWKYHNFQYEQTFLIAKVNKGKSLEEFIENSQAYQSKLLKLAIDSYRRKKNSGITGIFQFMFIDCWDSISWSIVDYYGKKKNGYDSVKKAYQPVYISIKPRQDTYLPGTKLNTDIFIINDTYRVYDCILLEVSINGQLIFELRDLSIEADSIQHISWENLNIKLPAEAQSGSSTVLFRLLNEMDMNLVSENEEQIEIVPAVAAQ